MLAGSGVTVKWLIAITVVNLNLVIYLTVILCEIVTLIEKFCI
jgi:hypothetical protein